jgi:Flp pilus assembly protein TadG
MDGLISFFRKFLRRQRGSIAVEFGILAPIFVLLVFGIVDLGHAWYMKMEVTSASREGARYGAYYHADTSNHHIIPDALNPSISDWVTSNYSSLLPSDANLQVTPGGPGYTSGSAGADLTVTVTATKTWFVLGNLIPGLGTSKSISATTDMQVE